MAYRLDPEDHERIALFAYAGNFSGKRVLEIGCGNGRLTWQYAHLAEHVTGIDPNQEKIAQAIPETPPEIQDKVDFWASGLESFKSSEKYDLAIFSWSL